MDAPNIGKLSKEHEMGDPRVGEMGGPQAGKLMRKVETGAAKVGEFLKKTQKSHQHGVAPDWIFSFRIKFVG